jgi:hypothetical protein
MAAKKRELDFEEEDTGDDLEPPTPIGGIKLNANAGTRQATVRLSNDDYDKCELVARAMNLSMTEYTRTALLAYTRTQAKNPKIREAAVKNALRTQKMMERLAAEFAED